MPHDGKSGLRELSKPQFLPLSANGSGKLQDSPRTQRSSNKFSISQLVSRQYAVYWVVWLLLCGGFAIRHTTKLLDAAGQQHYLLASPTDAATAAAAPPAQSMQQHLEQHNSSDASQGSTTSSRGAGAPAPPTSSTPAGAAAVLASQHSKWPDGYVAVCAVIKDQWPDLRYWIEYHRWLGVSKFYIYDNNSTLPAMLMLWDYMQEGVVDYQYFLGRPRRKPDFTDTNQYRAYQGCLLQHFKQHRWLAFIDADEFFVFPQHNSNSTGSTSNSNSSSRQDTSTSSSKAAQLPALQGLGALADAQDLQHGQFGFVQELDHDTTQDTTAQPGDPSSQQGALAPDPSDGVAVTTPNNLALFLSDFENQAAIGVNWVLFGSSGHLARPDEGPLGAYTACVPPTHWESTHVKVIANTGGVLGMGGTPHEVLPRAGKSIVDVDQVPFKGPKTQKAKWHKLLLHHYVLKSKAEFVAKQARGSGAGNKKDWGYWEYIEKLANQTCTEGVPVSKAFLASKPKLGLPESARVMHGCHSKAVAAYQALLQGASEAGKGTANEMSSISELLPC